MKPILSFILGLLFLTSCSDNGQTSSTENITEDDFLWQFIDSTVNPGDDFFKFATGRWMKDNPIPSSERRWGIGNLVRNDIYDKLRKISEDASLDEDAANGTNTQKIGDFWATGMDSVAIETAGVNPLKAQFEMIDAIKTKDDVLSVIAEFHKYAGSPLFSPIIYQDEMNSEQIVLHLYQGGLGLPDRDYYFKTDDRTSNIRKEYLTHVANMFRLMGDVDASASAAAGTVMKIETDLARSSRTIEDLRDQYANYNKMSLTALNAITPGIDWKKMLSSMDIGADTVIVGQPEFFRQAAKSIRDVSVNDWKTYLRWNLINSFASELSSDFDKEHFRFYGTVMSGVETQRPRWKRILDQEENFLGDALGQLYVGKFVSPEMRQRYDKLVDDMVDAFEDHIVNLDWMSDSTKSKARSKLRKISRKVCYPDQWKDYASLEIDRESFLGNVMRCRIWQYNYYVNKIGKPVDRSEWEMTPQTYNAYYNPSNNEIVLPAAQFLIPGLPDSLADDAIIYGYAAASTIGHELTHGFDDQGRQFDERGNLSNWWTAEDSIRFYQRANLLAEQFSNYTVLDSMNVNGNATLGENIADLGGLVIGLDAFRKTDQFKKNISRDGLTPVQRYFLGYTIGWLGHQRDASLAMQIMTGVHSPNFLRVNGPMSNIPEFYEAFGIREGDRMWRPDSIRVRIW